MKKKFLLSFLILFHQNLSAQNSAIKILKATQQSWYGGVEGMQGEKFYLEMEISNKITLDTFWIKSFPIQLVVANEQKNNQFNCEVSKHCKKLNYKIRIDYSFSSGANGVFQNPREIGQPAIDPPKKLSCDYLLTYHSRLANQEFCIKKFEQLESLYYP